MAEDNLLSIPPDEYEAQIAAGVKDPHKRRFLRVATLALSGLALSAARIKVGRGGNSDRKEPTGRELIKPTEDSYSIAGFKFFLNGEGLPYSYQTPAGGLCTISVEDIRQTREKAIMLGEPELFGFFRSDLGTQDVQTETEARPFTIELPKDVVGEEELTSRGIKIVNTDETTLHIRRSAFEAGGPLEKHAEGVMKPLDIVLVDGPTVSGDYMKDPRYSIYLDGMKRVDRFGPDLVRPGTVRDKMREYNDFLTKQAMKDKDEPLQIRTKVYAALLETVTPEEWEVCDRALVATYGLYLDSEDSHTGKDTVFVAVGRGRAVSGVGISFDSTGQLRFVSTGVSLTRLKYFESFPDDSGLEPTGRQSHFDPSSVEDSGMFRRLMGYQYEFNGNPPAGFVLRHELVHTKLVGGPEKDADLEAMGGLATAWRKWEESGFTDDSGYCFVFSLSNGGYMLAQGTRGGPAV